MTTRNRIDYEYGETQHHDFWVCDTRGRKIGAAVMLMTTTVTPDDGKLINYAWTNLEPGVYLTWCPHATRNGTHYGACQPYRHCKTEDERKAGIEAYLAGARKRAVILTNE